MLFNDGDGVQRADDDYSLNTLDSEVARAKARERKRKQEELRKKRGQVPSSRFAYDPEKARQEALLRKAEQRKEQEELAEMSGLHWTTNKQGQEVLIANIHNVAGYLANKSLPIWYDSFLRKIKYHDKDTDAIRNWEDRETLELTKQLQQFEGLRRIGRDIVDQGVNLYAFSEGRNELKEYLKSLEWDGQWPAGGWIK